MNVYKNKIKNNNIVKRLLINPSQASHWNTGFKNLKLILFFAQQNITKINVSQEEHMLLCDVFMFMTLMYMHTTLPFSIFLFIK